MKRILKWIGMSLVVLLVVIQAIRPAKNNPAVDETRTMKANTQMSPEVAAILERACSDCHSSKTTWPWYSQIAPVSWYIVRDVNGGRKELSLFEPYTDAPNTKGMITTPEAGISDLTRRCLGRGFQVATHAIGDAANHQVLDAYERALKQGSGATSGTSASVAGVGGNDARLRVEHAQVLAAADIPRFAALGVIASMQPTHCTSDMAWAEKRIGPARIKGAYAWRLVLRTGAHVPISSDFPGETLNPFYGIYAAVTRQDPQGKPEGGWYPDQRMTLEEALRGYTIEAAYAEFEEKQKGSIENGKLADLIVISKDPATVAPRELLRLSVSKTFIDGKLVYSSDAAR